MGRVFNRIKDKERRRSLRRHMPKSEVILWSRLKNRQMHGERFLRQFGVDAYVLDFYCPRLILAIEVDGDSYFVEGAEEYDMTRQKHIESSGIRFLRFTNNEVCRDIHGVCQRIYEEIENETNMKRVQERFTNPPPSASPLH
jgi:very-short-patch-repair endonuclease